MTVAVDHKELYGSGGAAAPGASQGSGQPAGPSPGNTSGPINRIDPTLPQVFGRYLLVQRLSRGGMGEIFLAKHGLQGFEKLCVIKKVLPNLAEDEQFISRFVDEAQVAIKLQHTNVAQVFEVGRVGDEYFLAIEYIEGRDLRRTLQVMARQKRRFAPELALFVGREMVNGLAYAHRRTSTDGASLHLVHCDISPPNILVSFEGETKIIDFGIAKSALRATATDPKMGFGKFGYMAPEQLIRGGVVDHRTDIYAAGVVLYELLTGERLYELGESPDYRALARAVSRGEHRLPSDFDPALGIFDELVAKALRPRAEERYQTAAEFRDAIQTLLVHVAPTMSSDHLGSYLREVFAHEMSAHQELVERVAHMHLDAFREQLTTQSVETVSFALANMPLVAPAERPVAHAVKVAPQRTSQQRTAIAGMMLTESGPTGTVELSDVDLVLADATIAASRRGRSWPVIGAAAVAVLSIAILIGFAAKKSRQSPPAPAAALPAPAPTIEPLAAEIPSDPVPVPVPEVAPAPKVVPAAKPIPSGSGRRPKQAKTEVKKPEPKVVAADPPSVDSDATGAKFKAVSREYKKFKQAYGSRLDAEWTDLATFAQYASKSPEKLSQLERKIDRFRSLMKAQK